MQKSRFQILNFTSCVLILGSCILYFTSCHHDSKDAIKDASPYFTGLFTGNEDAVFRGINFNETSDAVKKTETSKLYESTPDHLFYEVTFPKDSTPFSEYANVQYFFNENNQLDIITADIYLTDSLQEIKLKNTLTSFYNQQYKSEDNEENNYSTWKGKFTDKDDGKKYNFSVSLKELADDYGVSLEYVRE